MRQAKAKTIHVLLATAVLGLVALPIAFAGAADSPQATASASVKKQLKKLKKRVAQLEGQGAPDSLPPSGPAGGDLTGNYPNPQIGPNAVGSDELADDSVGTAEIQGSAVTGNKLALDSVGSLALVADSVGASELKGVNATVGGGVSIANGAVDTASVTCPGGTMVIGGGFAWNDQEANSIIDSAPSEADPNQTWVVTGRAEGGSSNTLFAWANCLAV